MRKFLKLFFAAMLVFLAVHPGNPACAQDAHFSQYYATPLQTNPAMTGVFDGKFRLSNSFRNQWSSLGKGYSTLHLSADAPVAKGFLGSNFFGVGFLLYQDKAGEAGYRSTIVEASAAYIAGLDEGGDHFFSIGFQTGLNQQSIDISKATWDDQWNGDQFDPGIPSMENIQLQQFSYLDFNAGVLYYYVPDINNMLSFGASMSHIGSPNISFFKDGKDPLHRKISTTGSADISLTKDNLAWLEPRYMVTFQGKQKEILAGGYFKSKLQFKSKYTNYKKEAYFYFGGFVRVNDAAILSARVEYNTLSLGLSYDINMSNLSTLAGGNNAFEITLAFTSYVKRGQRARHFNKMPRFM